MKVVALALEIAGACVTLSVKFCVTGEPTPLVAVNDGEYPPLVPGPGVPASVAVPSRMPAETRRAACLWRSVLASDQ